MDYTRQLSQFAAHLRYADLPQPVIEKAKEIALHAWGLQLAGSTLPWSRAVYRYAQGQGGAPISTVVNYGLKTSPVNAAFVNGTFGHGFEMDDNHAASGVKGGCVAVPALLAIGEQQLSSGTDFIVAMVAAFEVMIRVSLAAQPDLLNGSYQASGTCGPFGAAAGVGKLLRFDEQTMLHAISIAGAHSSGITESPPSGRGSVKRIYGGMAGSNGMRAALLAAEGLTGPDTMIEGERGFCRGVCRKPNLPALTAGLGSQWHILDVHYKIYAQDGYIQPMTEALDRIVRQHRFKPQDVAEIKAGTNQHALDVIGLITEPGDLTAAQFSANFSLALYLVTGNAGFQEYTERNLRAPEIIDLSRKIRAEVDPEIEDEWQKTRPRGARITVRLKSGATYTDCVHMLRSMSAEDVNEKFRRLAKVAVSEQQCEQLLKTARHLDAVRDVSSLVPLLVRSRGTAP